MTSQRTSEAAFTRKLIAALKRHPALKDALIWKVSDRFSAGRPDLQIILNGVTTYFEIKVAPYKTTKLQDWTLRKIGKERAHIAIKTKYSFDLIGFGGDGDYGDGVLRSSIDLDGLIEKIIQACEGKPFILYEGQRQV